MRGDGDNALEDLFVIIRMEVRRKDVDQLAKFLDDYFGDSEGSELFDFFIQKNYPGLDVEYQHVDYRILRTADLKRRKGG